MALGRDETLARSPGTQSNLERQAKTRERGAGKRIANVRLVFRGLSKTRQWDQPSQWTPDLLLADGNERSFMKGTTTNLYRRAVRWCWVVLRAYLVAWAPGSGLLTGRREEYLWHDRARGRTE